nr:hypothetical protein CFP56_34788 [Quercus suber]
MGGAKLEACDLFEQVLLGGDINYVPHMSPQLLHGSMFQKPHCADLPTLSLHPGRSSDSGRSTSCDPDLYAGAIEEATLHICMAIRWDLGFAKFDKRYYCAVQKTMSPLFVHEDLAYVHDQIKLDWSGLRLPEV